MFWKQIYSIAACVTLLFAQQLVYAQPLAWSPQQPLNDYAVVDKDDDTHPHVAASTSGTAVAAWVKPTAIAVARSDSNGTNWTQAQDIRVSATVVNQVGVADAGDSTWVALATADELPYANTGKVVMLRSNDDGQSWSDPQDIYSGQLSSEIDIAADTSGTLIAVTNKVMLRSSDSGETWTSSPLPAAKEPYETRITCTASGVFVIAYRIYNYPDTQTIEIRKALSSDGGESWQEEVVSQSFLNSAQLHLADVAAYGSKVAIAQVVYPSGPPWDQNRLEVLVSSDGGGSFSAPNTVVTSEVTDLDVALSVDSDNIHIMLDPGYLPPDKEILSFRSTDNGTTWHPLELPNAADQAELQPTITPLPSGESLAVYQVLSTTNPVQPGPDGDIAAVKISESETTWAQLTYLNSAPATDLPVIDDVELEIAGAPHGTVIAIWTAKSKFGWDISISRSENFGKTWSAAWPLTSPLLPVAADREAQITHVENTTWLATWHTGSYPFTFYSSKSTDDGITWSSPQLLDTNGRGEVASNGSGTLLKAFIKETGTYATDDDLLIFSRSTDHGDTWTTTTTTTPGWNDIVRHLVHVGGTTWFLAAKNHAYRTTDDGQSWQYIETPGADIGGMHNVGTNHAGVIMAVVSGRSYGTGQSTFETYSRTSFDSGSSWDSISIEKQTNIASGFPFSEYPQPRVAWIGGTKWIVVWHTIDLSIPGQTEFDSRVHYAISDNNGSTWSPPAAIAPAGSNPPVGQVFPQISMHQGKTVVAWHTKPDVLAEVPVYGYDSDLFFSTTTIPGFATRAQDWQLFD